MIVPCKQPHSKTHRTGRTREKQTTLLVRLPARPKSKVIVFKMGESHSSSTREPASMFVTIWKVVLTSVQHMNLKLLTCYTEDQVDGGPDV